MGKFPPNVQMTLVIGVFALVILIIMSGAGGSLSVFPLSFKASFGHNNLSEIALKLGR